MDEGLGAVYFGIVPEAVAPFRAAFGVPDDQEPIGAIAIGHDAETDKRDLRSRRRNLPVTHVGPLPAAGRRRVGRRRVTLAR